MGTINSSDRIAATLRSLTLHKGDSNDDNNNNNNLLSLFCGAESAAKKLK
jgi:hypothetical protein